MNNSNVQMPDTEINLKEVIWNLLGAWKSILIVAITMALLVSGAKYWKDSKAFAESEAHAKELARQSEMSEEDRISQLLDTLTTKDRNTVAFLIQQQQMVNTQKHYLENSLLLNTDPAEQRTLELKYYLKSEGDVDLQALVDGYNAMLKRNDAIKALGKVLAPETETKYIYELIELSSGQIMDSDTKDAICSIEVVLPDGVKAEDVEKITGDILLRCREEVISRIGNHSIELVSRDVAYTFNTEVVDRRIAINNSINGLLNNIKNNSSSLSEEQRAVFDKAIAIIDGEKPQDSNNAAGSISKPSFSKKFMLVGFIIGCLLYAGIYLLVVVLRGAVESDEILADYTGSRLLGSIHYPVKYKGIHALTHSSFVDRIRYQNVGNIERQLQKVISTVDSVCKHENISIARLFRVNDGKCKDEDVITDKLVKALNDIGIKTSLTTVTRDTDEKVFLTNEDSICLISKGDKLADVWNLTEMLVRYNIKSIGNIYIGPQ